MTEWVFEAGRSLSDQENTISKLGKKEKDESGGAPGARMYGGRENGTKTESRCADEEMSVYLCPGRVASNGRKKNWKFT